MAAEAKTNSGSKFFICVTPARRETSPRPGSPHTYVQVKKVSSVGERGINTNIITPDIWDASVSLEGKGITNAGDPPVELAEDLTDSGQIALRAAGAPNLSDAYAFKIKRADGSYLRDLVAGPNTPGGRNEDVLNTYVLGLDQPPVVVTAPATP
jgi:hypothetical protein